MTHWKKCMNKEFLGSWDLDGRKSVVLTIRDVVAGEVKSERGTDKRPIATFERTPKKMILNSTNCKAIEKMYGTDIEGWSGKRVEIFVASVSVGGDQVDALRIRNRVPSGPATTAAPDLAPETTDTETGEITGGEGGEE